MGLVSRKIPQNGLMAWDGAIIWVCAQSIPDPEARSFFFLSTLLVLPLFGLLKGYSFALLQRPIPSALSAFIIFGGWFLILNTFFLPPNGSSPPLELFFQILTSALCARMALGIVITHLQKHKVFTRKIALVGAGNACKDAILSLSSSLHDIEIVGIFDDRAGDRSTDYLCGHPRIGTIHDLASFARNERIDLIIVAIHLSAERRLLEILHKLWELPIDIQISARYAGKSFYQKNKGYIGTLPVLTLFNRPLSGWSTVWKTLFDYTLASLLILILWPLFLLIALCIRLETKGPVLFRQKRYGFNNRSIEIYKFRSMHTDQEDKEAERLVSRNDTRVTKVGRFLRKTSLDELPQLFNVLEGKLSLVGPRPHAPKAKAGALLYEQVVDGYFARHKLKPGITGWAQINGWRGETDTAEKIQGRLDFDLDYINRWSLAFDALILLKTPWALLNTENSY